MEDAGACAGKKSRLQVGMPEQPGRQNWPKRVDAVTNQQPKYLSEEMTLNARPASPCRHQQTDAIRGNTGSESGKGHSDGND